VGRKQILPVNQQQRTCVGDSEDALAERKGITGSTSSTDGTHDAYITEAPELLCLSPENICLQDSRGPILRRKSFFGHPVREDAVRVMYWEAASSGYCQCSPLDFTMIRVQDNNNQSDSRQGENTDVLWFYWPCKLGKHWVKDEPSRHMRGQSIQALNTLEKATDAGFNLA
jgi:hypothetical protein